MSDPLEASNEGCNCLYWQYADALASIASAYSDLPKNDEAGPVLLEAMRLTVDRMKPKEKAKIERVK